MLKMTKYPWQTIDPKDFFALESQQELTMSDIQILTKLYLPIIGRDAHALYQLLFSELNFRAGNKDIRISRLLTKLEIGIPDFYHARLRLEGLGLLRIYQASQNEETFAYQIQAPLAASEFMKDSLLRTLLLEKIGERMFNEARTELLPASDIQKSHKEITRSFLDVYHLNLNQTDVFDQANTIDLSETKKRPKIVKSIEAVESFDYPFFKAGLSKHFIRDNALTEEIKELVYTFHVVYGINEMEMQRFILDSADIETGAVDKNKFIQVIERYYLNKQKQPKQVADAVVQTTANQQESAPIIKNISLSEGERKVVAHAKRVAPFNYLESIKEQKDGFVTSSERWLLKELVEQSPLTSEVINILLHYILVVQGSVILEKNYAMKIANDWAQNGVQSAEGAIEKVKELYNQSQEIGKQTKSNRFSKNYQRQGKKESLPDWAKESSKPSKPDQQVSNQDADSVRAQLDRIRRLRQSKEGS